MNKNRSSFYIMFHLILLIQPLIFIMVLAIILGTCGYLCATFITILAGELVLNSLNLYPISLSIHHTFILMVILAVSRGLLHYAEQYCNHYIAFKLLALIRHEVFEKLRILCPAKLEGKDKGNLISILTSDIELLEVFYAHTISPILIAVLTSLILLFFIAQFHIEASLLALFSYLCIGLFIPCINSKLGRDKGLKYRDEFGDLNSFVLDSLRGLDETIQYEQDDYRKKEMEDRSNQLNSLNQSLSFNASIQKSLTNMVILLATLAMLVLTIHLYGQNKMTIDGILICTISLMSSFGPVVALSNLSNNLNQTLASGQRVLDLLDEEPIVYENHQESDEIKFNGMDISHISFSYNQEKILKDFSLKVKKGKILGIYGSSGSGKSTLLKLIMRFWDVQKGSISISEGNIKEINTSYLRNMESYVTQDTYLFHDTIAKNISIAKLDATQEEIEAAAKKASIHDFILSLENGYETNVGELGDTLSDGQKQRIGLARAFLHDSDLILLDEPTSNLDALNESVILKSIKEKAEEKTVILVSHRDSTMHITDDILEMNQGRIS